MTISSPPPPPQPPTYAAQPAKASQQAVTALVLGIVGLVCCHIVAPVAWYMGNAESKAIREGRAPAAGEGYAKAGMILGIIGSILLVIGLLWLVFGGMAVLSGILSNARH